MRNFLQLLLLAGFITGMTVSVDAQVVLGGTVDYTSGSETFTAGDGIQNRVCSGVPIDLNTGSATSACAGRGGVDRAFFVTGTTGGNDQREITLVAPNNTVTVTGPTYFRFCVRCNNGDMIESAPLFFRPSPTNAARENCADVILPVELVSFDANNLREGVSLKWTTVSEVNNSGFEVELSTDGRTFEAISFVEGNGTTNDKVEYSYLHKTNRPGSLYYRLKQMDYDGVFEYSGIVEVTRNNDAGNEKVIIYPNPAQSVFVVNVNNPKREFASIKVMDLRGVVVFEETYKKGDAPQFVEKEFNDLNQNNYIVVTRVGTEITTKQVILLGN